MKIEEIENKVALGEMTSAQVFTQMKQFIKVDKVELTPKDMAELFANLDASEQAEFLNEVANCASKWAYLFAFNSNQ